MNHWSRPVLIALGVLVPCYARAAEPNKLECIAANGSAQDLRRAGKLREAREKLAVCVSESCPGPVREDCAQRLAEVDQAMPSIVFEAKDGAGNDVASVTVTMDGQRVDKPGMPVQADPGEHRFVFEAEGMPRTEKTIVVREGERERHERVVPRAFRWRRVRLRLRLRRPKRGRFRSAPSRSCSEWAGVRRPGRRERPRVRLQVELRPRASDRVRQQPEWLLAAGRAGRPECSRPSNGVDRRVRCGRCAARGGGGAVLHGAED